MVRILSPWLPCAPWPFQSHQLSVLLWQHFGISCPQTRGEIGCSIHQQAPQGRGLRIPSSEGVPQMEISQPKNKQETA